MKITIKHDLKAGVYLSDDARVSFDAGAGEGAELTLDFQLTETLPPPVDPPPPPSPPDPPAPPAPPSPPAPPAPPSPPTTSEAVARFSFVVDGSIVTFTDETTGAAKEQWAWGDGGTSAAMGDQSKQYSKAGTYAVTLIAWDAAGKASKYIASVTTIEDKPVVAPPPTQPPASTRAAFNGTVLRNTLTVNNFSLGAVSQMWDWGDGTTSTEVSPRHTYQTTGTFRVRLTCTAADGTSNWYENHIGAIVPLPEVGLPADDVSGQPVQLSVVLSDGYTVNMTLHPGDVEPLDGANPSRGAAVYYADGLCVCLVNDYAGTTGDASGHFTLTAGDALLFDGDLMLPAHAGTRPFWLVAPPMKPTPDMTAMPKLGQGSENASWASTYDAGDNGPTGVGNMLLAIGAGGEHATLGPVTEWDACYLTNPTADNARVVRGMADAAAPVPFHVRDFGTGKMLDVRTYPRASMQDTQRGVGSNPIAAFTTRWPFLLGQAQSHATNYGALACTLWGTEFDREQAAMWANYICSLNQNYLYRSPLGCCAFRNNAARGFGRALTVLLNAATHAPIEFRPMFQAWVNEAAADGAAAWVGAPGMGIMQQGGALAGNVNAYAEKEFAPWMQDILTAAVGQAIQYGFTAFQPILDTFADFTFSRVEADHEFGRPPPLAGARPAEGAVGRLAPRGLTRPSQMSLRLPDTITMLAAPDVDGILLYVGTRKKTYVLRGPSIDTCTLKSASATGVVPGSMTMIPAEALALDGVLVPTPVWVGTDGVPYAGTEAGVVPLSAHFAYPTYDRAAAIHVERGGLSRYIVAGQGGRTSALAMSDYAEGEVIDAGP
ncbi:PKD domain-containing protein [Rhodanobacter lindaniclasticus]